MYTDLGVSMYAGQVAVWACMAAHNRLRTPGFQGTRQGQCGAGFGLKNSAFAFRELGRYLARLKPLRRYGELEAEDFPVWVWYLQAQREGEWDFSQPLPVGLVYAVAHLP
ncbi:unnamed protein product [Calypogeia fissa]